MTAQGKFSAELVAAVRSALPPADSEGEPPRLIAQRVGCWSLITIRHVLRRLVDQGIATCAGEDRSRRYRLACEREGT